jgi:RNA polymerase sigma-70 factor (ECF subfamily)
LSVGEPNEEAHAHALRRFEALFRQNADAVLAYATRRSDPDTAQEVVAETFAVAWRRLDAIPDPELPWLLGVARKVLANEWRSRSRAAALTLRLVREPRESPHDPADVVAARLSAQAALDRLHPSEREALELIAWEGLTAAQAADVLGCSRVAITMRIHRARRRFHRFLAEPPDVQTLLSGSPEIEPRRTDLITRVASTKEADDAS